MRLFKKDYEEGTCEHCLRSGMMQHHVIELEDKFKMNHFLCSKCLKELIRFICQLELRYEK